MRWVAFKTIKPLLSNTTWVVGSEIVAKISRIAVIFTLAATLQATEYGTVMLALATHEIFKLVQRAGAGAQIIQCNTQQLNSFLQNGIIIQWGLGILLFLFQVSCSFLLAHLFERPLLVPLLSTMAVVYLLFPLVSMHVFLMQRANALKAFSVRNAFCIGVENLTIAAAVLLDAGVYSVVIAKWVFLLSWLLCFSRVSYIVPKAAFCKHTFKHLIRSSAKILIGELSKALKNQADMFAGAKFLSPEAFGIYSFAKTAGVNLGVSLSAAFNASVYPFLCEQKRKLSTCSASPVYFLCLCLSFLFLFQAAFVPVYVPLLFVQDWQQEYLTIALLCLANIPITWTDTYCNQYRANGRFERESVLRFISLAVAVIFFSFWPSSGFYAHAVGMLILNIIIFSFLSAEQLSKAMLFQNFLKEKRS